MAVRPYPGDPIPDCAELSGGIDDNTAQEPIVEPLATALRGTHPPPAACGGGTAAARRPPKYPTGGRCHEHGQGDDAAAHARDPTLPGIRDHDFGGAIAPR